jgi:hypothetical protein
VVRGIELGLPTKAIVFSPPKYPVVSSVNMSSIPKVLDAFSLGLMQPSYGATQLLTSSVVNTQ